MSNEENTTNEEKKETPPLRRIVIETDGNKIKISVNETTGLLEFKAILSELLSKLV